MDQVVLGERIEKCIFLLRGQKVMLDMDLAVLYGVETRVLNQAVKRNKERFPEDFIFQLTRREIERISQFVTSSNRYANLKFSKNVTAFTEHGVAMLSSALDPLRRCSSSAYRCGYAVVVAPGIQQPGTRNAAARRSSFASSGESNAARARF